MNWTHLFVLLLTPALSQAEVITDNTFGTRTELAGKSFEITPELGRLMDRNMFYSFERFSLQPDESAIFSGSASIQNIIARVTGGSPSLINGALRSTIEDANVYLMNPAGISFGAHAVLDINGSFHATTANELRFQDGAVFSANPTTSELLTVAPIHSFGFLSDTPAAIHLEHSRLAVPSGHTISLLGGKIDLRGEELKDAQGEIVSERGITFMNFPIPSYTAELKAAEGRINLASLASQGEVTIQNDDLVVSASRLDNISLDHAEVKTTGQGGGNIFIRGADLTLQHGRVVNTVDGQQNGGIIDIQADNLSISGSVTTSGVQAESHGTGRGSQIRIHANNLELFGGSINASVYDQGDGGNIEVHVANKIELRNLAPSLLNYAGIYSDTYGMQEHAGRGGNVQVEAGRIEIYPVSSIASASYGRGVTGDIHIKVQSEISVTGRTLINGWSHNATISNGSYLGSAFTKAFGREGKGGNSGNIHIEAQKITLADIGLIISDAYGADAGQIDIRADVVDIQSGGNIGCSTFGAGKGGSITINAQQLLISENMANRQYPSGIYSDSLSDQADAGAAGDIKISANTISLFDHSVIASSTQNAAGGGIQLIANQLLYLQNSKITTSVSGGTSDSGNISVTDTSFIISNNGKIIAQAEAGRGGDIRLVMQHFIPSAESITSASSRLGIDGRVFISSPINDLSAQILGLTTDFVDGTNFFPRSCAARISDQRPSEFVRPFTLTVLPHPPKQSPDDLQPSSQLSRK